MSKYLNAESILQGEFYEDYSAYVEELEEELEKQRKDEESQFKARR